MLLASVATANHLEAGAPVPAEPYENNATDKWSQARAVSCAPSKHGVRYLLSVPLATETILNLGAHEFLKGHKHTAERPLLRAP